MRQKTLAIGARVELRRRQKGDARQTWEQHTQTQTLCSVKERSEKAGHVPAAGRSSRTGLQRAPPQPRAQAATRLAGRKQAGRRQTWMSKSSVLSF